MTSSPLAVPSNLHLSAKTSALPPITPNFNSSALHSTHETTSRETAVTRAFSQIPTCIASCVSTSFPHLVQTDAGSICSTLSAILHGGMGSSEVLKCMQVDLGCREFVGADRIVEGLEKSCWNYWGGGGESIGRPGVGKGAVRKVQLRPGYGGKRVAGAQSAAARGNVTGMGQARNASNSTVNVVKVEDERLKLGVLMPMVVISVVVALFFD
ncbi:hypothetical protein HDU97_000118 [Phlyctochytrium planicorne]|nr:hypothetical protein HDU97_000118 [Phlyctochytrium planicorne]